MTELLAYLPIANIRKPRISLRPIRRNTPEYVELVESIRKDGVLQPLLVRPWEDEHEVVEGWHRLTAAKEAGLLVVPCIIREMTDDEVLIVQVKCNAIRPKTFSFEYARRLKILMEKGLTLLELSAIVDKSPKWIQDQIHLNRLCEEARPSVESGDIQMGSALALANLPEDLQKKFLPDAVEMKQAEFMPRAKGALRDYKAFLLKEQQEDREIGAANPNLRSINMLKREAGKPTHAKKVLRRMKAETPLDGWEACLAWIFRLDPLTVDKRRAKEKEPNEVAATQAEYRKLNRDMIRKFVKPQSETGDYRNGK
jgi:ParB/RepB/Spo0J family partition protein